jgi:hypothetical protein
MHTEAPSHTEITEHVDATDGANHEFDGHDGIDSPMSAPLALDPAMLFILMPQKHLAMVLDIFTARHIPVTRTVVYDEISVAGHEENLVYALPPPLDFMPVEEQEIDMHTADSPMKLSVAECKDVEWHSFCSLKWVMIAPKGKGVINNRRELDADELAARRLPSPIKTDVGLVATRVVAPARRNNWDISCPDGHQIAREYECLVGRCGCFYSRKTDMISHLKRIHTFHEAAVDGQDSQSSIASTSPPGLARPHKTQKMAAGTALACASTSPAVRGGSPPRKSPIQQTVSDATTKAYASDEDGTLSPTISTGTQPFEDLDENQDLFAGESHQRAADDAMGELDGYSERKVEDMDLSELLDDTDALERVFKSGMYTEKNRLLRDRVLQASGVIGCDQMVADRSIPGQNKLRRAAPEDLTTPGVKVTAGFFCTTCGLAWGKWQSAWVDHVDKKKCGPDVKTRAAGKYKNLEGGRDQRDTDARQATARDRIERVFDAGDPTQKITSGRPLGVSSEVAKETMWRGGTRLKVSATSAPTIGHHMAIIAGITPRADGGFEPSMAPKNGAVLQFPVPPKWRGREDECFGELQKWQAHTVFLGVDHAALQIVAMGDPMVDDVANIAAQTTVADALVNKAPGDPTPPFSFVEIYMPAVRRDGEDSVSEGVLEAGTIVEAVVPRTDTEDEHDRRTSESSMWRDPTWFRARVVEAPAPGTTEITVVFAPDRDENGRVSESGDVCIDGPLHEFAGSWCQGQSHVLPVSAVRTLKANINTTELQYGIVLARTEAVDEGAAQLHVRWLEQVAATVEPDDGDYTVDIGGKRH